MQTRNSKIGSQQHSLGTDVDEASSVKVKESSSKRNRMHRSCSYVVATFFFVAFFTSSLEVTDALLLFPNSRSHRIPQDDSPTQWLANAIWGDAQNRTGPLMIQDELVSSDLDEALDKPLKRRGRLRQAIRNMGAFLLVQAIRLVLLFHLEGPVLRRLPSQVLFEIVRECLREQARAQLLRVVATELDRRRQDYKFGDVSRYTWKHFTKMWKQQFGKEYEFGDITRGVLERAAQVSESEGWKTRLQEELDRMQFEWKGSDKKGRKSKVTKSKKRSNHSDEKYENKSK